MQFLCRYDELTTLADQPGDQEWAAVAGKGFKTVINLRMPAELPEPEGPKVRGAGMEYVELPVGPPTMNDATVAAFGKAWEEAKARGPVLVHCATARRASALCVMLDAVKGGWTAERALERARETGFPGDPPPLRAFFESYVRGRGAR